MCLLGKRVCNMGTCGTGLCLLTPTPPYYKCKCIPPFAPPNCRSSKTYSTELMLHQATVSEQTNWFGYRMLRPKSKTGEMKICGLYMFCLWFLSFCLAAPCNPNPCQNKGRCVVDEGDFDCICPDGYSGQYCQVGECIITEPLHFSPWINFCV